MFLLDAVLTKYSNNLGQFHISEINLLLTKRYNQYVLAMPDRTVNADRVAHSTTARYPSICPMDTGMDMYLFSISPFDDIR